MLGFLLQGRAVISHVPERKPGFSVPLVPLNPVRLLAYLQLGVTSEDQRTQVDVTAE